jgi:CMP-N-acetylneuraminic acid synthetase/quercetin dioxygenase-like cupin family protein
MKIVGMIPARLGSKRIFQKNLRILGGKPLIAHIIESAISSNKFDEIYINSESDIFKEIAKNYGIKFYKRNENLAGDSNINDEFLIDFARNIESDICIQLLPTSPFVESNQIASFVDELLNNKFDTLVSTSRHQIAAIYDGKPINFTFNEPHRSSQTMNPVYTYATVLMGWNTMQLIKNYETNGYGYHGEEGKTGYYELSGLASIDIDNEDDFILAEYVANNKLQQESKIPEYYKPSETIEIDVPAILVKDGIQVTDFDNENLPISDLTSIINESDSTLSWCRRIVNTENNSATLISQLPGEGNRLHYHPDWNEWWYILRGEWKWEVEGEELIVKEGNLVFIEKNKWHKITAIGKVPAVRLAVSRQDVKHVYKK